MPASVPSLWPPQLSVLLRSQPQIHTSPADLNAGAFFGDGFFRGRTEFPLMSVACIPASQNARVLLAYRCSRSIEGALRLRRQALVTDHPLGFEGQGPGSLGPDHER
jgi:hypothetical protein